MAAANNPAHIIPMNNNNTTNKSKEDLRGEENEDENGERKSRKRKSRKSKHRHRSRSKGDPTEDAGGEGRGERDGEKQINSKIAFDNYFLFNFSCNIQRRCWIIPKPTGFDVPDIGQKSRWNNLPERQGGVSLKYQLLEERIYDEQ